VAAVVALLGAHDLEGYELSFFSLNRGTAVEATGVLGQPVYTLAVGYGVRLPLHGSLGASPAAVLAPHLPAPLTYWLVLALAIGAAALVTRQALEALCGRLISWLALVLLFCSVPIVNYTIHDDWPETAVTYCAFVGCVFAPKALLSLLDSTASSNRRRLGALSVAGIVWSLMALSHAGYWPLLAVTLVLAGMLALSDADHPFPTRVKAVTTLAVAALVPVALQAPDIVRELDVARAAGGLSRFVQGPDGSLLSANAFPLGDLGPRRPFTYLLMTLASAVIGLTADGAPLRRLIVGTAVISVGLGIGASTLPPGPGMFAPSNTWALRDPATVFAVFSAACAAAAVRRSRGCNRRLRRGPVLAALALTALQGPAYAGTLAITEVRGASAAISWTQDLTAPWDAVSQRGLSPDRVAGSRLAFWPGVRSRMRDARRSATDFADAGALLVTAATKTRTMRGLLEPNERLFNQGIDLSSDVLCDGDAVRFLRLRFLLRPAGVPVCAPWSRIPDLLVDGSLDVDIAPHVDDRVSGLPSARLTESLVRNPALSAGSELLPALVPLPGTSLTITVPEIVVRLRGAAMRIVALGLVQALEGM